MASLQDTVKELLATIAEQQKQHAEQQKQHQEDMKSLIKALTPRAEVENDDAGAPVQIVESRTTKAANIASSMETFEYIPEDNSTFETYYNRYKNIFETEVPNWPESEKVRLLLRKFSTADYNRFAHLMLPNEPDKMPFDDVVSELKLMFGRTETQFNMRYKSFSVKKEEKESFQDYGARINKIGEKFDVKNFTADDLKTLLFVSGLKDEHESHILEYLLKKVNSQQRRIEAAPDQAAREAIAKLKISDLVSEALNIISLKADKKEVINHASTSAAVNAVHDSNKKNAKKYSKSSNSPSGNRKMSRPCKFCGGEHWDNECSFEGHCSTCSGSGHKTGFCKSALESYQAELKRLRKKMEPGVSTNQVSKKSPENGRKYITPLINGVPVKLQIDSASDITIISSNVWKKIRKPTETLASADIVPKSASGGPVHLEGAFIASIQLNDQSSTATVYVSHRLNLLGNDLMTTFHLWDTPLSAVCNSIEFNSSHKSLAAEAEKLFPSVFSGGLGLCTKTKASLELVSGAKPIFRKARSVPFAAMPEIEAEIERQIHLGVYTPIKYSDFAAPIVAVKKKNGKVRLCGDYSTGLNAILQPNNFPLPTPEQIFTGLTGMKILSKIDKSDAFLQCELDEFSKKLCVVNTHMGLMAVNRLPFGIKTAPPIFQEIMTKMLSGVRGAYAYLDDIILGGATEEEHREVLHNVLARIRDYGFKLNLEKCQFAQTRILFCSHIIDADGIRPDPEMIQSISNIPRPIDVTQLRSFLGSVNYYGKFVKGMTDLRGPLDELTKKDVRFQWEPKHEEAFNKLKKVLNSDLVLTHYDPKRKIVVAADASSYGKSGTLMHEFPGGKLRPIFHVSQSLNAAEKNYPQIHREAAALDFTVKRFRPYIYGRKFELQTDHQPLLAIFGSKAGIPAVTSSRLQRNALTLLAFEFDIKYVNTKDFGYADMMSRLIASHSTPNEDVVIAAIQPGDLDDDFHCFATDTAHRLPIKFNDVRRAQQACPDLRIVAEFIEKGWPDSKKRIINPEVAKYFAQRDHFNLIQGCIFYGERILIPTIYRNRILEELHIGHPGIVRMKLLARSKVFWHQIDSDIENVVKKCDACAKAGKSPIKCSLQSWPIANSPMNRIHIDYAGPIDESFYFVAVDAFSKWPEIFRTKSTMTIKTIEMLEEIFTRYGYCSTLVSDNGPQFTADAFKNYCLSKGIEHIRTAPYHPQSNGQAEKFVDLLKTGLRKAKGNADEKLREFLSAYRSTPSYSLGMKSPAELFFGRGMRTQLDLLMPPAPQVRNEKMELQFNTHHGAKPKEFAVGDKIFYQLHSGNASWNWEPATVIAKLGGVNYNIATESGRTIKAHANQLKQRYQTIEADTCIEDDDEDPNKENVIPSPSDQNIIQNEINNEDEPEEIRPPAEQHPVIRHSTRSNFGKPAKRFE